MSVPGVKPAFSIAFTRSPTLAVAGQVGGEAALVAETGRVARGLQLCAQHVVGLDAPAERLGVGLRADRREEELLHVDAVVGVLAAVDDVKSGTGSTCAFGPPR